LKFSVIVPAYNAQMTLPLLLDSLETQTYSDYEVIVVDDASVDQTAKMAQNYRCHLIRLGQNRGPAYCRNIGAQSADGDIFVFTDSDCRVEKNWLNGFHTCFSSNEAAAVMGRLVLLPSNLLGDCISALGFPAGGTVGFDKIWQVDRYGFTHSLSTCNCAIQKSAFLEAGGFDTSFPFPGGEDSLLAYRLRDLQYPIKYCPYVTAYHGARSSFKTFLKWQLHRGISSYLFAAKISKKSSYVSLRLWSTGNILQKFHRDPKFPIILMLLATSVVAQLAGFFLGKLKRKTYAGFNH
jgi:GT2 family glycosyltransferase